MPRLNPKQLKFIQRYLATGNATQSYIDAGYSKDPEAARRNASRLLTNDDVKRAIVEAHKKAVEKFPLTYEAALQNMWDQARWYGEDASHMARVKATEVVMDHFRPPVSQPGQPGGVNVNVAVLSDAELLRRIDALEGGTRPESGTQRLLEVAADPPAEVQMGLAPPPRDSTTTQARD